MEADGRQKCLQVRSYTEAWSFRRLCQRSQSTCRLAGETPAPVGKENVSQCVISMRAMFWYVLQTDFIDQPEEYNS